jgi:hippurate hydrolase
VETFIEKSYRNLESLYRHLHSNPELSLKEEKTSARLAEELEKIGLKVTRRIGGYGIVALLENGKGPVVLVRADMDALPVTERTGVPYASRVPGVAHACGHDVHMTCLVGTAHLLHEIRDRWGGTLVFIAQPAEEKGHGAQAMLEDGLFSRFPRPDYALALHVDSQLATGKIGYRSGYAFANVDSVDITIQGRGGHGAYPHLAVDPIVIASEVVLALQTIVSRVVKAYEPVVVTVGSFHSGTKHNIIPDQAKLELTVRSSGDEVRNEILEAIRRIATEIARAHRAPQDPEVKVTESIPSTYNDPQLVARLVPVLKKIFGDSNVVEKDPEMGGEDFGLYGRAGVPAFLFRVGSVPPQKISASLHSSTYAPDPEPTIKNGVRAMASAVLELAQ